MASELLTDRPRLAREEFVCTNRLYGRLSPEEVGEIEALIRARPELESVLALEGDPRKGMLIAYGICFGHGGAIAATGLRPVDVPEDIHMIGRGPLAPAGGLYEANLVASSLASAGVDVAAVADGLDFGCSSGRVVRVLAAAYPQARWRGCDPNAAAIGWARANLPEAEFFVSPKRPPLDAPAASLDLVLAISIWSHFAPELGLRWFQEMHRLLRPGGHIVLTAHGLTSLRVESAVRPAAECERILADLNGRGWWYAPEFGEQGDWGVSDPEWGTCFLSPEWLLSELCPRWQVAEFAPGRNDSNQDVYVLRRS